MSSLTSRITSYKEFNIEVSDFERHIKMVTKPDRAGRKEIVVMCNKIKRGRVALF